MKEVAIISTKASLLRDRFIVELSTLLKNEAVLAECSLEGNRILDGFQTKSLLEIIDTSDELAYIEQDGCIHCGKCQRVCHFAAIENDFGTYTVDPDFCTACGYCVKICPTTTIKQKERKTGEIKLYETVSQLPVLQVLPSSNSPMVGKLLTRIKNKARQVALDQKREILLFHAELTTELPLVELLDNARFVILLLHDLPQLGPELKMLSRYINELDQTVGGVVLQSTSGKTDSSILKKMFEDHGLKGLNRMDRDSSSEFIAEFWQDVKRKWPVEALKNV